ncbi:hypothetical protein G6N05_08860 [Flavobacterium sp. F372]|uniref:Lipoprotein n=1 Tax=Flavobacterium bernardetii TaxID=2813823 RepID=A0ABR7IXQ5_9FLAO|nr:hypothetical protein [Flavobacterium bernardetii]MBC5834569.1 hypothetical protein [Flavobacterium bernardetii]NHF70217.1 hypothetical protein [Flavobacterium bernardetii]
MKNIKLVVVFLVATLLVSCNITEKVIINSDGTGKVSYNFNMSKFVETISKMGDKQKESAKALFSESDKDIDSTFHFKDFKAMATKKGDTLTPEQIAVFEKLEKFSIHSVMNKKKGQAYFELYGTFKNIDELNNMEAPTSTLQKASGKNADAMSGMGGLFNDTKTTMTFKGNLFSRSVVKKEIVIDTSAYDSEDMYEDSDTTAYVEDSTYVYEDYADSTSVDVVDDEEYVEEVEEEKEMSKADLKKMNKEFKQIGKLTGKALKDSKYVLEYTFPRKIKTVSVKNYKLSKDKKTIFISFSIEDYIKAPERLSFTIELENL